MEQWGPLRQRTEVRLATITGVCAVLMLLAAAPITLLFAYRESRRQPSATAWEVDAVISTPTLTGGRYWRREYPVMVYPGPTPLATSGGTSAVGTGVV